MNITLTARKIDAVDNEKHDIFLELDEETLARELGIASRIHRLKVLKLISGDYDARSYLGGCTSV